MQQENFLQERSVRKMLMRKGTCPDGNQRRRNKTMNRYFKMLSASFVAAFFVGGLYTFAAAAVPLHGPAKTATVTGKVTRYGGLISTSGTPYLLYGYRASALRKDADHTVTVTGIPSLRKGQKTITVLSYKLGKPTRMARAEQVPKPASMGAKTGQVSSPAPQAGGAHPQVRQPASHAGSSMKHAG